MPFPVSFLKASNFLFLCFLLLEKKKMKYYLWLSDDVIVLLLYHSLPHQFSLVSVGRPAGFVRLFPMLILISTL